MPPKVHIVTSDSGWILEKCAKEIANLSNDFSYSMSEKTDADIQYYVTYGCRKKRVSKIEGGFFTHLESNESAKNKFLKEAKNMDFCVTMASRYFDLIRNNCNTNVVNIKPGVDLNEYKPSLKIGVVGRTYHTGRKGENLVKDLLDIPNIEWLFTGKGWPLPSQKIDDGEMTKFYGGLDYVLVPSLYEGGPMSVIEALACGVQVIAPDVGWVKDYPHIPYKTGCSTSLKAVLLRLFEKKNILRSNVLSQTWSKWGEEHLKLFDRLYHANSNNILTYAPSVTLITHGDEGSIKGGPSIRAPKTAQRLKKVNPNVNYISDLNSANNSDIDHIFNVWSPHSSLAAIQKSKLSGKKVVFSPIFLDLSWHKFSVNTLPGYFHKTSLDEARKKIERKLVEMHDKTNLPFSEVIPGFHSLINQQIALSDGIIFLGEHEKKCLEHIVPSLANKPSCLIRNTTGSIFHGEFVRDQFVSNKLGIEDYILCVGRIEPRKNQLLLALVARLMKKKLILVGACGNKRYLELLKSIGGEYVHHLGYVKPESNYLKSLYVNADVFVLPSFSEGAPLAALEAASCGVPLVLSDRSSESEYFGALADYVAPLDIEGMIQSISFRSSLKDDSQYKTSLKNLILHEYTWDKHVGETNQFYGQISSMKGAKVDEPLSSQVVNISEKDIFDCLVVDITDYIYSPNPTGIPRVVEQIFSETKANASINLCFICWKKDTRMMIPLPDELLRLPKNDLQKQVLHYLENITIGSSLPYDIKVIKNSKLPIFLFVGGGWTSPDFGHLFIDALARFKIQYQLPFVALIHDLIRWELSFLYHASLGKAFCNNLARLLPHVDVALYYSEATKSTLTQFNNTYKCNNSLDYRKIKLGADMLSGMADVDGSRFEDHGIYKGRYILYVATLEPRKNHDFLLDVWLDTVSQLKNRDSCTLVFVGRSSQDDKLMRKMSHPLFKNSGVIHLQRVSDIDLNWLYQNCLFTVFPSLSEGWGLPVSESLAYGKFCIASDSSSIKEISPDLVELIKPRDHKGWVDALRFYINSSDVLSSREKLIADNYQIVTWSDSYSSVVKALSDYPFKDLGFRKHLMALDSIYFSGLNLNDYENLSGFLNDGWFFQADSTGHWMVNDKALISFLIAPVDLETAFIRLYLTSPVSQLITISFNSFSYEANLAGQCFIDLPLDSSMEKIHNCFYSAHVCFSSSVIFDGDGRQLRLKLDAMGIFTSHQTVSSIMNADNASNPTLKSKLQFVTGHSPTTFQKASDGGNAFVSTPYSSTGSPSVVDYYSEITQMGLESFIQKYSAYFEAPNQSIDGVLMKMRLEAAINYFKSKQ